MNRLIDPLHPLLVTSLRATRRAFWIVAAIVLPFGAFCLSAPAWSDEGTGTTVGVMAIGALCVGVGAFAIKMIAAHWDLDQAPPVRVLRERPGDIVWIYVQEIQAGAYGVQRRTFNIQLALRDGKTLTLAVKRKHRDELMALLTDALDDFAAEAGLAPALAG